MRTARWSPPALRIGGSKEGGERHASWLELFFDLVFVVAVAELAHKLGGDISPAGFAGFVVLFIVVWWAWVGETFYDNRFDTDDPLHRLLTILQMFAVAALAVNVHDAFGATATGFTLSYVAIRAILVAQYLRAGRHAPAARPLTRRYARGFALAAAIWLLSAFTPPPWRFALAALALAVDFGTPILAGRLHADLAPDSAHLPERFGLFTLIVLGESVVAVVRSLAGQGWGPASVAEGLLGLGIAAGIWWVYFDNLDGAAIRAARGAGRTGLYQVWLYAHFPLVVGLAATGVGVEHALTSDPAAALPAAERWLLCGAVALSLLAVGVIHLATAAAGSARCKQVQVMGRLAGAAVALLLAPLGAGLPPLAAIGALTAICACQVALDLRGLAAASGGADDARERELAR
jgi:low temperature requirement protein LtrA